MAPSTFLLPGQQAAGLYPWNYQSRPPLHNPRSGRTDGRQHSMVNGNNLCNYSAQDARGNRDERVQEHPRMDFRQAPEVSRPATGFSSQVNTRGNPSRENHDATFTGGMALSVARTHPHYSNTGPEQHRSQQNEGTRDMRLTI
jgi:hypothetical protein